MISNNKMILNPVVAILVFCVCSIPGPAAAGEVVLMTHDSFSISEPVLKLLEQAVGAELKILKAGDAGAALTQAILSKNAPMADVFFGVDNTFMGRALSADIFLPYDSPNQAALNHALKLDPKNRLLPVDFGDVCLNFDKKWFAEKSVAPPADLTDLTKPAYKDLLAVENPATSSPGLAFLLATVSRFGQDGYLGYWEKLRQNGALVTQGWKEAYWGAFTAASDGDRPIVVSYATSPPVEVLYAKTPLKEAPTAAVTAPGSCFRQIEFMGILKGAKHLDAAKKLVDFMLSKTFQEDIPLQMFVFPALPSAKLPEVFVKYGRIAKDPAELPYSTIDENRQEWIEDWTEVVLQ